jgi:hypothetical protein
MTKLFFRVTFVLLLLPLFGCGTSEYEKRLETGSKAASENSKFSVLGELTVIPGTSIGLRFPKVMQSIDINDPQRGKCVVLDPKGEKNLLNLTGHKATYEGTVKDTSGNELHYYIYVGVAELKVTETSSWSTSLMQGFPNADAATSGGSSDYTVESPQGTTVTWEEMHFKCDQNFYYPTKDKPQNVQKLPGNIVGLSHMDSGIATMVIFRYPSILADRHEADFNSDWIKLIAGTLRVESAQ